MYLASGLFKQLQGLTDEISQVLSFPLTVLDFVTNSVVVISEDIKNGKDLPVVGYKGLSNHFS